MHWISKIELHNWVSSLKFFHSEDLFFWVLVPFKYNFLVPSSFMNLFLDSPVDKNMANVTLLV